MGPSWVSFQRQPGCCCAGWVTWGKWGHALGTCGLCSVEPLCVAALRGCLEHTQRELPAAGTGPAAAAGQERSGHGAVKPSVQISLARLSRDPTALAALVPLRAIPSPMARAHVGQDWVYSALVLRHQIHIIQLGSNAVTYLKVLRYCPANNEGVIFRLKYSRPASWFFKLSSTLHALQHVISFSNSSKFVTALKK